ncbi:hypothetical protein NGRA_2956 [Nosema granulosis]|uniref:Uncharacterized protein n=1 Tax=Nosema granulosis TaxID=83296 RepID=A0A9P6GYC3_9MICR|nr:hypothetical protein NGRA_2956 [Nosema granulosis]
MKEHGLFKLYINDKQYRDILKEIMSLPFLNPDRISEAFKECSEVLLKLDNENKRIEKFVQYIKNTFISANSDSRYPIHEWCVYERMQKDQFLTTKSCDS